MPKPVNLKGIVKSGNAGNSSKPDPKKSLASDNASPSPPPLFPPGFKYPISLLQERCQKLGWEKPVVETRACGDKGFSFVVTISRHNKSTSEKDIVKLEPHPPYYRQTAIEARHWGATYALYRFSNGIQLNRVLPPGPRDYWNDLATEHKTVDEHRKWMYYADPFDAKKMVEERQAKAQHREEVKISQSGRPKLDGSVSSGYPDVIMATSLRKLVEDAIKQGNLLYPNEKESALILAPDTIPEIRRQLDLLGFRKSQIQDVIAFLSTDSSLTSNLLNSLPPLEASLEYLILHLPECDIPQKFLPKTNSSIPFISSAHSGNDDLNRRWIEEKAVKEAGWPTNAVKECTNNPELLKNWPLLMAELGRKLVGEVEESNSLSHALSPYPIDVEEYESLGGHLEEEGHLVVPLFSAPICVHVLFSAIERFPRPGYIPMYVTSATIPPYVRLHVLSRFLLTMRSESQLEPGEGFCLALMRIFEDEWAKIDDRPPDISAVLRNLAAPRVRFAPVTNEDNSDFTQSSATSKNPIWSRKGNDMDSTQIRSRFESIIAAEKYKSLLEIRKRLPVFKAKEEFLDKVHHHRVVVVVGETGSGKTTQLPQFILDSLILSNRGSEASIVVTQPRRISAISVAARVSEERLNDGSVGYAIRGESNQNKNTRLLFCTTGIVLRRLNSGDSLKNVSHIIVDEVHERSMDVDFLLLELKDALKKYPTLKLIVMSATINHELLVNYFDGAPLLTIPGFLHPITDKYLEDILPMINYQPKNKISSLAKGLFEEYTSQGIEDSIINSLQTIISSNTIDYQLIAELAYHIISTADSRDGIIIFLPGVNEIRQCMDAIQRKVERKDATIFALHANLSSDEQRRIFLPSKSWKIIVATNIAETSITVDGIVYVIDSGKFKENQYDSDTNVSRLVEIWENRAAATQRRGRAGRTRPGVCYKLYTRKQESDMESFQVPEILRVPLESIVLSVKASRKDEDVKLFLSQAIDPPSIDAMDRALKTLEELGAIDEDGRLTALGKHMSMLPIDIRLAKMLILATIFQCLGPIATVAAILSSKPLFLSPIDKREEANSARARFATADSDLLTDVKAFDECMKMQSEGRSQSHLKSFCDQNFISFTGLREISTLRQDFVSSVAETGIIPLDSTPFTPFLNIYSRNVNIVKATILGGLWPRVARVHLPDKHIKYDKVSAGTVQRDNTAKDFRFFDLQEGRVFLHPGSILFGNSNWKPPFVVYFNKYSSSKIFLKDATKVPTYALLLFGGSVSVNHIRGGVIVGNKDNLIKLNAIPVIGVLVNSLRRLLDAQLQKIIEEGTPLATGSGNPIVQAIIALLNEDGRTEILNSEKETSLK